MICMLDDFIEYVTADGCNKNSTKKKRKKKMPFFLQNDVFLIFFL